VYTKKILQLLKTNLAVLFCSVKGLLELTFILEVNVAKHFTEGCHNATFGCGCQKSEPMVSWTESENEVVSF